MAASTTEFNSPQAGNTPIPDFCVLPVKTLTTIYQGVMVGIDSTGYAVMGGNASTAVQKIMGKAFGDGDIGIDGNVDNSAGLDGAKKVRVRQGAFYWQNSGSSIAATDIGKACYAASDISVHLSDGAGLRPFAGIILGVDSVLGVLVLMGGLPMFAAGGSIADSIAGLVSPLFRARAVAVSALAAYTAAAGVITANANGAIGSVFDGVTVAAGDTVFLPEGIAAAAKDAGPYVITQLGSGGTPFILTRPNWWNFGSTIVQGQTIQIGPEGTLWHGSEWKTFVTTATKVVDTDAPLFWPKTVTFSVALVAGTVTVTTVPVRSTTTTAVIIHRIVANTSTATTGGYHPTNAGANGITAGALGTASVIIQATVAAGTINAADISTVSITFVNY